MLNFNEKHFDIGKLYQLVVRWPLSMWKSLAWVRVPKRTQPRRLQRHLMIVDQVRFSFNNRHRWRRHRFEGNADFFLEVIKFTTPLLIIWHNHRSLFGTSEFDKRLQIDRSHQLHHYHIHCQRHLCSTWDQMQMCQCVSFPQTQE